jgi:hypothetical protein
VRHSKVSRMKRPREATATEGEEAIALETRMVSAV